MIKDRDVRDALSTLESEFENLEETVKDQEKDLENLQEIADQRQSRIEELEAQVKELEEALAEAYLTDEADDGRDTEESDDRVQCGRELDVLDTADDEASY